MEFERKNIRRFDSKKIAKKLSETTANPEISFTTNLNRDFISSVKQIQHILSIETHHKLTDFSKLYGYSVFNILLNVFGLLISRYLDRESIVISFPVSVKLNKFKRIKILSKRRINEVKLFNFSFAYLFVYHELNNKINKKYIKNT